jgi:putative ABC transport system permease protein
MSMLILAGSSLRQRFGSCAAGFLNLFLGGAVLVGFASLYTTGSAPGVSHADQGTLTTMSYVIGLWGLVIVVFGVASTLGLLVRQRARELALLKAIGATPKQIGRLVRGETALLCLLAAVPAVVVGYLAGLAMVAALKSTHQIAPGVRFQFGPYAIGAGLLDTFLAAFCAAWYAARRATKPTATEALTAAEVERPRLGRKRLIFGLVFLLIGADCGTLTLTVLKN